MSNIPKLPGTKFARYLEQETEKFYGKKSVGIFNDIEQGQKNDEFIPVVTFGFTARLRKYVSEHVGFLCPPLTYRGRIDSRIPRPFPGPAKEGSFWLNEWDGVIGGGYVNPGDIIVRLTQPWHEGSELEWLIVPSEELPPDEFMENLSANPEAEAPAPPPALAKGFPHLSLKLPGNNKPHKGPNKPRRLKAAPGDSKRKIVLEDE